jgi:hypothetical protein
MATTTATQPITSTGKQSEQWRVFRNLWKDAKAAERRDLAWYGYYRAADVQRAGSFAPKMSAILGAAPNCSRTLASLRVRICKQGMQAAFLPPVTSFGAAPNYSTEYLDYMPNHARYSRRHPLTMCYPTMAGVNGSGLKLAGNRKAWTHWKTDVRGWSRTNTTVAVEELLTALGLTIADVRDYIRSHRDENGRRIRSVFVLDVMDWRSRMWV